MVSFIAIVLKPKRQRDLLSCRAHASCTNHFIKQPYANGFCHAIPSSKPCYEHFYSGKDLRLPNRPRSGPSLRTAAHSEVKRSLNGSDAFIVEPLARHFTQSAEAFFFFFFVFDTPFNFAPISNNKASNNPSVVNYDTTSPDYP